MPSGREPTPSERAEISRHLPGLEKAPFFITGPHDRTYNCVGSVLAAMKRNLRFQTPVEEAIAYQKSLGRDSPYSQEWRCWDLFMSMHGLVRAATPSATDPVIAVYAKGDPEHVALRIDAEGDWWESKLGEGPRIVHHLQDIAPHNGVVAAYYVFKPMTWDDPPSS